MCVYGLHRYTMCISEDGLVYSFGSHARGAHGHIETFIAKPSVIPSLQCIKTIACSTSHSICLDFNGNVFTFGRNDYGALGVYSDSNTLQYSHKPLKLQLPSIHQVSCGEYFSVCLSEDGDLYSFGYNDFGQLGHGDTKNYYFPKKIEILKGVEFIECGGCYSICKTFNDDIYSWGANNGGQLGIVNTTPQYTPHQCMNWPDNIVDIKCGTAHTLILTSNQEVFACGSNSFGQLGKIHEKTVTPIQKIDNLCNIIRIECGDTHSMCIDINNNLYVFGDNKRGQLGLDEIDKMRIPTKHPLLNIVDISSKGRQTFVKTSTNEIYTFGKNTTHSRLESKTEEKSKQNTVFQVFQGKEDIWCSNINIKSKAKSARSILPRPNEEVISQKKKQKTK